MAIVLNPRLAPWATFCRRSAANVGRVSCLQQALDALREGYDVYPVADAIGGTSEEAHRAGLERVAQAGGQPISWVALACELQRDWARQETVPAIVEIVLTERLLKE